MIAALTDDIHLTLEAMRFQHDLDEDVISVRTMRSLAEGAALVVIDGRPPIHPAIIARCGAR